MQILIADNRPEVRSALRLLLEQEPGITIAGEAAKSEDLLAHITASHPDVLLLDYHLNGLNVKELLPVLRSLCPHLLVIALCGRPEMRQEAIADGADAFVSKGDSPENLLATIKDCQYRQQ
jgi:DNA-binding NarL/FixJ family response regulator